MADDEIDLNKLTTKEMFIKIMGEIKNMESSFHEVRGLQDKFHEQNLKIKALETTIKFLLPIISIVASIAVNIITSFFNK